MPADILIPLIAAVLYALAAILLKRAMQDGAETWRVAFVCNMVMAVGYQLCWVMRTRPFSESGAMAAALTGCVFFAGQIFTFLALNRADVSVATPILGTKVIWVAGLSVLLAGRTISPHIWMAVFLTATGTAILGYQPGAHPHRVALSIGLALATAGSFAASDVLTLKYAPGWGFGSFVPFMFLVVGALSLGFLPLLKGGNWAPAWLGTGSVMLAIQALGMAFAIATYGHATKTNIAYNSRGLWTIVLIWVIGHWFGNTERNRGAGIMLVRLAGASLLVAAIFIASS